VLEMAVLGLLTEGPLHGYELRKRLGDSLGVLSGVSFGSLYPALRRLERNGAIEVLDPAGTAEPLLAATTGSLEGDLAAARRRRRPLANRRPRKAYRITDRGRALFAELLSAQESAGGDEERTFALKIAFCRFLPRDRRLEMLERRRARLLERLAKSRSALTGERNPDPYVRSLLEHRTKSIEHDLEWVDELLAGERAAQTESPDPAHQGARA
jgi:DNA-binding PadR family transcriptional regulator